MKIMKEKEIYLEKIKAANNQSSSINKTIIRRKMQTNTT